MTTLVVTLDAQRYFLYCVPAAVCAEVSIMRYTFIISQAAW